MYQCKLIIFILLATLIFDGLNANDSLSSDQPPFICSTGESILSAWEKMLSRGYLEVSQDKGGAWKVTKHLWVSGSGSYDINPSDTPESPPFLIVKFKTKHCGSNFFSPKANGPYYQAFQRKCGFTSAQEALANCRDNDFVDYNSMPHTGNIYDISVTYSYQSGSWVISNGNENFTIFFGEGLKNNLNREYFRDLLKVTAP
ncbi:MAG: hypothetical protein CVU55_02970 [Deltaproteobacteria bacterium HGW-Deltaproteobacteria-13]|jgi:hypothetical protein|nr:MAG: hypothetical protein CVU55_02970 [Deltaproteobacteria bacterium HGW-Deltaproteobacteria-13]